MRRERDRDLANANSMMVAGMLANGVTMFFTVMDKLYGVAVRNILAIYTRIILMVMVATHTAQVPLTRASSKWIKNMVEAPTLGHVDNN